MALKVFPYVDLFQLYFSEADFAPVPEQMKGDSLHGFLRFW